MGFFTEVADRSDILTTLARAARRGSGLATLRQVRHHMRADEIARESLSSALANLPPAAFARLQEMQRQGTADRPFFDTEVRPALLNVNRLSADQIELLPPEAYFALTPHVPHPKAKSGERWGQDQVLVNSPDELRQATDEGNAILARSQCAMGLPAAGVASRAADIFNSRPDLVGIMHYLVGHLEGLDGLEPGTFPPRFLYPVASDRGIITLLGMMLENLDTIGREYNVIIPSLLMLHPEMAEHVLGRLAPKIWKWSQDQQESVLLWAQSMSKWFYVADQAPVAGLRPNGHGEHPRMLAEQRIFNFLAEKGINYYFFGNADEIMFSPNPILVGIAKRLIQKGYAGIVFVVENPNNQAGGGPVRHKDRPDNAHLIENPAMPREFVAGGIYPPCINTLSMIFDTRRLAAVSPNLAEHTTLLLEAKAFEGRHGAVELVARAEGHAGTEMTDPYKKPEDWRIAFVYISRPGFFTGIKTPAHVYDQTTPPELVGDETFGRMSYATYIRHLVNTYPQILRAMADRDSRIIEQIFLRGGSYLLPIG